MSSLVCSACLPAQDSTTNIDADFIVKPPFAWNRTDQYVAPDFETFFPDDAEAGKRLDALIEGKLKSASDDERLALIRRGLRNTSHHRTTLLSSLGNEFIWNKAPQHARAIELMYHASDSDTAEVSSTAMYHGPTVVLNRTPNLIRMLMEKYQSLDMQTQGRIVWGMQTYGERDASAELLRQFLSAPNVTTDDALAAALDVYEDVLDTPIDSVERFADVGTWVIAYHRTDLSSAHPRASSILRTPVDKELRGHENSLLGFVTRVHRGHEVAVFVVKGLEKRSWLVDRFTKYKNFEIDFNEYLSPRVLQERRLREFAKLLPDGMPPRARPEYSRPPADAEYAHLASTFVAPDFDAFFADDLEAGKQLDALYAERESLTVTDAKLLELFQHGVRRSAHGPNVMFGWISSALGWPHDPQLTEIQYQGMDVAAPIGFRNAANYYGFGLGTIKSDNILEAMYRSYLAPPFDRINNQNMRPRILWGVREHEDDKHFLATRFLTSLNDHASLSDDQLQLADLAYRQLTDQEPPNAAEYADRSNFVVIFGIAESQTLEANEVALKGRFGELKQLLDVRVMKSEQGDCGISIVRGQRGVDELMANLKQPPKLTPYVIERLTRELIDQSQ